MPRQTCSTTVPHQLVIEMRRVESEPKKELPQNVANVVENSELRRTGNSNKMNEAAGGEEEEAKNKTTTSWPNEY